MKRAAKVLPHATIVMAGMMIVFFLIDRVNTPMGFMTNEFHKWLSFLLAISCVGYSVLLIVWQNQMEDRKRARERQARRTARPPQDSAPVKQRPAQQRPAPQRPVQSRPAQGGARPAQGNRVQSR